MSNSAEEAINLVYGDRNEKYGHPGPIYEKVAHLWSAYLDHPISTLQAAMMMALMKIAREEMRPGKNHDSLVDAHGFLLVYERILNREKGLE